MTDLLGEIDVVVLDKDGTLFDFHAMWGGWARELVSRLESSARRPVAPDVFAAIGFDPSTGHVAPGGPLAIGTMGEIESLVESVLRRWCPSVAAARLVAEAAWFEPDPVGLAVPLVDLPATLDALAAGGRRQLAVATTDDRGPTDATLRAAGIRDRFATLCCGDDGFAVKPEPDGLLAICQALRVMPARMAVVGDTPADLRSARAAGAGLAVGVLSGLGTEADLAPLADAILATVADLVPPR